MQLLSAVKTNSRKMSGSEKAALQMAEVFCCWQNGLTLLYFCFHFLICIFGSVTQRHHCGAHRAAQKQSYDKPEHIVNPS